MDWGVDVSTFVDGDLSPNFTLVSGPRAVAEAVLRLWLTPRGMLITDPDAGFSVLVMLGASVDDESGRLFALESQLRHQAIRDERVYDCLVRVTVDRATETMRISGQITLVEGGSFEFVYKLSASSIEILEPRLS